MGLELVVPPVDFNVTTDATWETFDARAAGVPAAANGVIVRATNGNVGQNSIIGSRKLGSTFTETSKLTGTDPAQQELLYIGLDDLGQFQLYASTASLVSFRLGGWFDDQNTFLTDPVALATPPNTEVWTAVDLSPTVGDNSIKAAIILKTDVVSQSINWGVRPGGSTDDLEERNSDYTTRIVGVSSDNQIELKTNSPNIRYWLLGWVVSGAEFLINKNDYTFTERGQWVDLPALPDKAYAAWFWFGDPAISLGFDSSYGLRPKGSTDTTLYSLHRYTDQDATVPENNLVQAYIESTAVSMAGLGYFEQATLTRQIVMGQVNDCKYAALLSDLGVTDGQIDDLELAWLHSLIVSATKAQQINDAWMQYWDQLGIAAGQYNDRAYAFLKSQGAFGDHITDLWFDYWCRVKGTIGSVLFDTFTDTNGTRITDHTPDVGGPWDGASSLTSSPSLDAVLIQDNQLSMPLDSAGCVVDVGSSDIDVSSTYIPGANSKSGLWVLHATNGNGYTIRCRTPVAESVFEIVRWDAGVPTTVATVAYTWTAGKRYKLRGVVLNNEITAYLDGAPLLTHTATAHLTATKAGICGFGTDNLERFDDCIIRVAE